MESQVAGYPVGYGVAYPGPYGGEAPPSFPPPSSTGGQTRPTYFHTMSVGLLVFLPAIIFLVISCALALLYHQLPVVCWSLTAICAGLAVMFMMVKPTREGPKYWFNLGCLCFLATVAANVAGLWNFYRHFALYWAYEGQREYTNVLPGEPALSHLDAGKIIFSSDARVDQSSSLGLMDGQRFCVAPIVGSQRPDKIQYWAAGINCCDHTGNFACDDAAGKQARAGIVYLDYGPRRSQLEHFRRAAREAGAAHGAQMSKDALFVAWVEDPDQAQRWYWTSGMAFLTGGVLIYLAFSSVVGVMLHFTRRTVPPKSKLESRTA